MTLDGETETQIGTIYLDGTFWELGPEEEAFFQAETGIQDTEELRKHIIEIQEEAYKASNRSHAYWVRWPRAVTSRFVFNRSTRIRAFVGLDSRNSRSPRCLRIHAS